MGPVTTKVEMRISCAVWVDMKPVLSELFLGFQMKPSLNYYFRPSVEVPLFVEEKGKRVGTVP